MAFLAIKLGHRLYLRHFTVLFAHKESNLVGKSTEIHREITLPIRVIFVLQSMRLHRVQTNVVGRMAWAYDFDCRTFLCAAARRRR